MIENGANKTRDPRGKKQPSSLSLILDNLVVWLRFTDTWMQPIIVSIARVKTFDIILIYDSLSLDRKLVAAD